MAKIDLRSSLSFGYEQTFTIPDWWSDEGFTATSDTPLKRKKMLELAQELAAELNGHFKESLDIWEHMQYETFDAKGKQSFYVTMDPGSIEVKTPPCLGEEAASMAEPLFVAAERAGLVAYRNWWYGVKGGTEGGCHVNMGGFSPATNPLKQNPGLAVKYCAYIHNRPWLHYPFMGIDVGPGGNSMRMDEKPGFEQVKEAFARYQEQLSQGKEFSADQIHEFLKNTNLISEKASFPSLAKFKSPLYFIEDRAQEALRSPEEFQLAAQLRITIMEKLALAKAPEGLKSFENLHKQGLTSFYLWEKFQKWANQTGINPVPYQRFFERQFPALSMGKNVPKKFGIKEGRRPRVIKDIVKRGDTIVSKNIDTRYKRFELRFSTRSATWRFKIEGQRIQEISPLFKHEGHLTFGEDADAYYCYVDLVMDDLNPVLSATLVDTGNNKEIDSGQFNMNDMMWI